MPKPLRTLIVEDEFDARWIMHRLLEPYSVCDVAVSGDEALLAVALSCAEGSPYGLIMLDTTLPGSSIPVVLKEIRALEEQKQIPGHERARVVMVLGLDTEEATVDEIQADCEGVVSKPINKSDFLGQLHSLGFLQA